MKYQININIILYIVVNTIIITANKKNCAKNLLINHII